MEYLRENMTEEYYQGIIECLVAFAWWKDGKQQLGSCGRLLRDELKIVHEVKARSTKIDV